jgi:hypothetical protein
MSEIERINFKNTSFDPTSLTTGEINGTSEEDINTLTAGFRRFIKQAF